jgi:hypothetical protein
VRLHRRPAVWPIAVWWLLGAVGIIFATREVDFYRLHVLHEQSPRDISWGYVRLLLALQAGVVVVMTLVLRPWSYTARSYRALAGFAVALVLAGYFGLGLMHAPPEFGFLWVWVLATVVGCAVLAVRAGMAGRTTTPRVGEPPN